MAILTVGAGQTYSTIAAAVNASAAGDTVLVQAGTYLNDFITINHALTLQSVGGLAVIQATVSPPNGKAIITGEASLTLDGFGLTGAAVGDANGAGIRFEGAGDLVIRNSVFWDNQDGILVTAPPSTTVLIQNSEFSHNGAGDGQSHNIYIGNIASATIENSYFHDSVVGHEIKSRAATNVITGNRIFDNDGDSSYSIDLPQGGNGTITNNIIEKGANAQNWISIHFGGESSPYASSSLTVSGNTLINDNPNGYLLTNSISTAPVSLTGNSIWGYQDSHISIGPVTVSGNTTLATRPTLDLTTAAPAVLPPPVEPVTIPTPVAATSYLDFGREGAVTASGRILTVGAHGQFGSLATALLASQDGDTIQVAAGTYTNDFGVITHKVIIEGVGGIARFTQSPTLFDSPSALLTVSADATIRNVEITGASVTAHEIGLRVTAGHVTLVNDLIDNNFVGIWADANPDTTLSVYDSEIGPNGDVGKGTNNVQIMQIGSFTLKNSYVHGAIAGHEIYDLAFNSVIQGNRIIDGAGVPASFLLDLGQGGNALVQNNVFGKGADTANGVLIHVGGDGTIYDNSNVTISGNTLATGLTLASPHPYTYFIVNDASKGTVPLTVSNNLFVGGVAGSVQVTNGTATGSTTATTTLLDTSSPVSAALAPPLVQATPGLNTLVLSLTETLGQIDAQYIVSVDGADIGGGWVTAKDGVDAPQSVTFTGSWGAGTHTIAIRATDIFHRAPEAFAIFVKSVTLDGSTVSPNADLAFGALTWTGNLVGKSIAPPVVVPPVVPTGGNVGTITPVAPAQPVVSTTPAAPITPTPAATVNPSIGFVNATTNTSSVATLDTAAAGGPSYLQYQYIFAGNDSMAISTQAPNVFIHTGGGMDAIQVASGQNVLDGGLGSNFLTGGTGTDTFFTDARSAGAVWNTIRNFHAGDAATLWGFTAGVSSFSWDATAGGAAGSEGATLRANIVGGAGRTGNGIDASITFTGMSVEQAKGLQIVTGTQPAGNYLYIYNPGV